MMKTTGNLCVAAAALSSSVVLATPDRRSCDNFPSAPFNHMGGAWTFDADSSSITSDENVVSFTLGSTAAGVFIQTSEGYPVTTDFTARSMRSSTNCPATNPPIAASTNTGSFSGTLSATVEGLTTSTCGAVDVAVGHAASYAPGTVMTKTLDLCTASTPVTLPATTTPLATTAAAVTTTTATSDGSDTFGYQFSDADFNAFWYVFDDTIKIMWDVDFGAAVSNKWTAIGFKEDSSSSMGPAFFYIGLSDSLTVSSRELTGSGNSRPVTASDTTVIDSGCEIQDNRLHCFVVRALDGSADGNMNPNFNEEHVLLWAHGNANGGAFGNQHSSSTRGRSSDTVNFIQTAPATPSIEAGDISLFWSPTPVGNLDVYMSYAGSGADEWVGIGFGAGNSAMGPAEFYTGIASSGVTNRYLASGNSLPATKSSSNVLASDCGYNDGTTLTCSFSRPLADGASDAESLEAGNFYVRYAAGTVSSGSSIQKHDLANRGFSSAATPLFSVSTEPLAAGGSSSALYKLHGILMIIAWLFLLPFGIFVARFRSAVGMESGKPALWFRIHQPMQWIGVILMLISIIVIFVQAGPMTATYLGLTYSGGAHEVVGIISFALTLSQPVFAFCRNGVNETDGQRVEKCHNAWHIVHAVTGYTALVLALAAVAMGIAEYRMLPDWPDLFLAGYVVSVGGLLVFAVVGIALLIARQKTKDKHTHARTDAESQQPGSNPVGRNNAASHAAVAWVLFAVLLLGALLCAIAVGVDTTRDS